MMICGAIGFYLGIDTPPLEFDANQPNRKVDSAELFSAVGTFLAAMTALYIGRHYCASRESAHLLDHTNHVGLGDWLDDANYCRSHCTYSCVTPIHSIAPRSSFDPSMASGITLTKPPLRTLGDWPISGLGKRRVELVPCHFYDDPGAQCTKSHVESPWESTFGLVRRVQSTRSRYCGAPRYSWT